MDANAERKIEIFAPFNAALDLTKLILFQPFDLSKWFVIGFAAFLAYLGHSGGSGFNYNRGFGKGDWNWKVRSSTHDAFGWTETPTWLWPLILIGCVVIFAVIVLVMWLRARGKFIFIDCIVHNRGAIVQPWNEFKRQGNSFFLFTLLYMVCWLAIASLAATPFWLSFLLHREAPGGLSLVFGFALLGLTLLVTAIFYSLICTFMIPVMYRRRCSASEGFHAAVTAITARLGPALLYLLFIIVLYVAGVIIACMVTCLTCCIAAIPYIGTVILLPVYVFLTSYMLMFVRQFGPDYDAWGNMVALEPAAPLADAATPEPPPVQT